MYYNTMAPDEYLILVGASVRAAAGSARRAGMRPWGFDLFADADLRAVCPVQRLRAHYPRGFAELVARAPAGPWMYTGGLENWPGLVGKIGRLRRTWGNEPSVLRRVRSPELVWHQLRERELPCPQVAAASEQPPATVRWLVKPRCRAGGRAIRFWDGHRLSSAEQRRCYLQEFIEGESCSAVFVGDGEAALLLGVTRQLVGASWLHARPFQYCGSVGPWVLSRSAREGVQRLGRALVQSFRLRGLFGIDGILCDEIAWPVEVNPRYPASVEILELGTGVRALELHRRVFEGRPLPQACETSSSDYLVGKAILFAPERFTFPANGPWRSVLSDPPQANDMLTLADIPCVGEVIEPGQPILTVFAQEKTVASCLRLLQDEVRKLETQLFPANG